jgi:hypothetical protein
MSAPGNPASLRRLAIACAAVVVLPTDSVVLISISSLKISRLIRVVASSSSALDASAASSNHPAIRMSSIVEQGSG